jgi:hypothetical protein
MIEQSESHQKGLLSWLSLLGQTPYRFNCDSYTYISVGPSRQFLSAWVGHTSSPPACNSANSMLNVAQAA